MSQDDGWLLRKTQEGKFCLQHYSASADEYPEIDSEGPTVYPSLQKAIEHYEEAEDSSWPSEYGLSIHIKHITYDHQHKMESWGNASRRCAVTNCTYTTDLNGKSDDDA
jgi:hypothetical protein